MSLSFFDANVAVGRSQLASVFQPLDTPEALGSYLRAHAFAGALIWHWAQGEIHPESANQLLGAYRQVHPGVRAAWALLPPATGEQPRILQRLQTERVDAVRLFPQAHRYLMNAVVWGDLLSALVQRRIPVLLSLQHAVSWVQVYGLLDDYPDLTCILCDIGTWSMDRYTYPLLKAYPRLYLETSMLALEDGGLEAAVQQFGSGRFVFGTGFPTRYAEAAMLQLTQAELTDEDKQAVASENLIALLNHQRA